MKDNLFDNIVSEPIHDICTTKLFEDDVLYIIKNIIQNEHTANKVDIVKVGNGCYDVFCIQDNTTIFHSPFIKRLYCHFEILENEINFTRIRSNCTFINDIAYRLYNRTGYRIGIIEYKHDQFAPLLIRCLPCCISDKNLHIFDFIIKYERNYYAEVKLSSIKFDSYKTFAKYIKILITKSHIDKIKINNNSCSINCKKPYNVFVENNIKFTITSTHDLILDLSKFKENE